jgi:ubiquinone/menaquinone biosynthesis C-methylase UbiE
MNVVFRSIYQKLQEKRAKNIAPLLGQVIKKGDNVLDLGMGNGLIAKQLLLNHDINILGFDLKDYNITDVPLVICDSKRLPFEDNEFDVVLMICVLHHASDFTYLLTEAKRICKGRMVILEEVYSTAIEKVVVTFMDVISNLLTPMNMPFNFCREQEWLSIFNNLGLEVVFKQPLTIHWLNLVQRVLFVLAP